MDKKLGFVMILAVLAVIFFGENAPYGLALDDAWIHAAHARNLIEHGELSLEPSVLSAGVTSPLWTILYAGAYWVTNDAVKAVSLLALIVHLILVAGVYRLVFAVGSWTATLCAGLVAISGPLLWHSLSGMETNLFTAFLVWGAWATANKRWWWLSIFASLALLTRIEGILLVAPAFWEVFFGKQKTKAVNSLLLPLVCFTAFVLWNYSRTGMFLPSTLKAKQWGHGITQDRSVDGYLQDAWFLVSSWFGYWKYTISKSSAKWYEMAILLTVMLIGLVRLINLSRHRLGVSWFLLFLFTINVAYCILLPVQGAGGRYQAFNWLLLPVCTGLGITVFFQNLRSKNLGLQAFQLLLVVFFAFFAVSDSTRGFGKWQKAYYSHVEHIEYVHGRAGKLLHEQLKKNCLRSVIAYDIGAISFDLSDIFYKQAIGNDSKCVTKLVDLGGLNDPSVLVSLKANKGIAGFLSEGERALLVFPITLNDDPDSPNLGILMKGPARNKHPVDPNGKLFFSAIEEPSYKSEYGQHGLVYNNAPALWVGVVEKKSEGILLVENRR